MRKPRLFCERIDGVAAAVDGEEFHHASNVLRAKVGDEIELFNGRGDEADAVVRSISRKGLIASVGDVRHRDFDVPIRVTLAVAMPKQHRQGYLVEKCTELGLDALWPIATQRGVAQVASASIEKLQRRAVEAAKQARRAWVPRIIEPTTLAGCLAAASQYVSVAITDLAPAAVRFSNYLSGLPTGAQIMVLVGPEGGWTDQERADACAAGCVPTVLAPTILRVETAAAAVCAAVALRFHLPTDQPSAPNDVRESGS